MDKVYNFYNIEASFRTFLSAGNKTIQPVTIKNYLSDLRHFLGWLVLRLKTKEVELSDVTSESISEFVTKDEIGQYRAYLEKNNIPVKTINRRLSTLRKFCTFCISQQWMASNPAKQVKNLEAMTNSLERELKNDVLIEEFSEFLEKKGLGRQDNTNTIETIKEFLALQV